MDEESRNLLFGYAPSRRLLTTKLMVMRNKSPAENSGKHDNHDSNRSNDCVEAEVNVFGVLFNNKRRINVVCENRLNPSIHFLFCGFSFCTHKNKECMRSMHQNLLIQKYCSVNDSLDWYAMCSFEPPIMLSFFPALDNY